MAPPLTLVTGVSGFVGSAVAHALAARGAPVRGLVRASSPRGNLADFPGELVEGDLRDGDAVARAMQGVGHLFHVAADYRLWAPDPDEIVRNNAAMTRVVMEAALAAGVERLVYTSSVATLRPRDDRPADERDAATPDQAVGAYKRSKVIAERLVEEMVAARGLPAVIVQPSTPIGPRDVKPTPTGRIVVEAANGRMPAYVDAGLNLVHVDDVAAGHLLALDKGRIGERYILGGQDVMLGDMLARIAAIVGRRPPAVSIPRAPLFPLAWANERLARITGREPFLTLDSLRMAKHRMFFSSAKAEAELGYRARPHGEALADAIGWFREAGMIR
ncbi:NAD-dependent epimerase/dehydratase family protein [Sphingomonas sp. CL5.1]|uniref:hopanoid-associated sugar epimerase n=1 Tax=Sphingomonas sp. CL5.1 TaxID=2653203 RepID=UPI001582A977|nr:hopanoid-associated sugar epimerase [Sphingomonas sp. CL5.1]QKR99675.1 NAD-dependent epimerase/dehydratase family protein [Sphingomonas sp. CL5.1]